MAKKKEGAIRTQLKVSSHLRDLALALGDEQSGMTGGFEKIGAMTRLLALAYYKLEGSEDPSSQAIADEIRGLKIPEIYEAEKYQIRDEDGSILGWIF